MAASDPFNAARPTERRFRDAERPTSRGRALRGFRPNGAEWLALALGGTAMTTGCSFVGKPDARTESVLWVRPSNRAAPGTPPSGAPRADASSGRNVAERSKGAAAMVTGDGARKIGEEALDLGALDRLVGTWQSETDTTRFLLVIDGGHGFDVWAGQENRSACVQRGQLSVSSGLLIWHYRTNTCNADYAGDRAESALIGLDSEHFTVSFAGLPLSYQRVRPDR